MKQLELQPLASLQEGTLDFPEVNQSDGQDRGRPADLAGGTIPPPLSRIVRVDEHQGRRGARDRGRRRQSGQPSPLCSILPLSTGSASPQVQRQGQGRLFLRGTLAASLTQTCVVSLEPVASAFEVPVEIEFWPAQLVEELTRERRRDRQPWPARMAGADRRGKGRPRTRHLRDAGDLARSLSRGAKG